MGEVWAAAKQRNAHSNSKTSRNLEWNAFVDQSQALLHLFFIYLLFLLKMSIPSKYCLPYTSGINIFTYDVTHMKLSGISAWANRKCGGARRKWFRFSASTLTFHATVTCVGEKGRKSLNKLGPVTSIATSCATAKSMTSQQHMSNLILKTEPEKRAM